MKATTLAGHVAPFTPYVYRGTIHDLESPWISSKCGTRSGYRKHKRNHEPACQRCLNANREYQRTMYWAARGAV